MSEDLIKPDAVYKMLHMENMALSPATITKRLMPYLSDDETRHALRFLNFEEDLVSACDGHRFIRIDRDKIPGDIPEGAYRPVKDGKDYLLIKHQAQLELPDVDAVMPSTFDNEFELKAFDATSRGGVAELLYRLAQRSICISHQYAEEIPFGDYKVKMGKPGQKQVVLFEGIYTVGIMPLKLSF